MVPEPILVRIEDKARDGDRRKLPMVFSGNFTLFGHIQCTTYQCCEGQPVVPATVTRTSATTLDHENRTESDPRLTSNRLQEKPDVTRSEV